MLTASHLVRRVSLFVALVFGSLISFVSFAQDAISPEAQAQIASIIQAKRGFNDAQKKMDSRFVFAAKVASGDVNAAAYANALNWRTAVDTISTQSDSTPQLTDLVSVEISTSDTEAVAAAVIAGGGQVKGTFAEWGIVSADLQLGSLESIATLDSVKQVALASGAQTNVGALTSQGFVSHNAKTAVQNGVDGTGVTVGVLSDSASAARIAALIASGDLPPDTSVIPGQAGSGTDEGTAMMEIVHDVAPGAKLIFATAFSGEASFASNIIKLQQAGARVIVDDVGYFAEGAFQDGPIARAVNQVTAAGVIYFSSAANSGNLTLGTSGTWEGDFSSFGPVGPPLLALGETGTIHNFGTVASPQGFDVLTTSRTGQTITLKWSDPLLGSSNDYDLFILNSTGTTVKAFSAGVQSGTQNPVELVQYNSAVGDRIVVVLFAGAPRALRVDTHRGRLSIATSGSTYGHNAALNTMSTAATYWNSARTGTRPFTGAANPIEAFSSDGPRKIFFNPDGTPITPGNFLFGTNGGVTLQKPDITAADGNSAKTPGFNPFFGTSAAAPHAAGIAALVLQAAPWATVDQVKAAMRLSALDNMAPGVDRDSGFGIVMATLAIQYALTH